MAKQQGPQVAHDESDARQWLLTGDLPCLDCQYNLRGLVGPMVRCPECGHDNDLRQASAWSVKQLPMGVRQRQHWPSSAVVVALLAGGLGVGAVVGGVAGEMQVTVICGLIFVPLFVYWLALCRRWVLSCNQVPWALLILAVLHVATVLVMIGLPMIFSALRWLADPNWRWVPWPALALPVGLCGFWWVGHLLKGGQDAGMYRQDWRQWRIPVGDRQPVGLIDGADHGTGDVAGETGGEDGMGRTRR